MIEEVLKEYERKGIFDKIEYEPCHQSDGFYLTIEYDDYSAFYRLDLTNGGLEITIRSLSKKGKIIFWEQKEKNIRTARGLRKKLGEINLLYLYHQNRRFNKFYEKLAYFEKELF